MRVGLQAWGSEGDISPFIALAAALAGRGHDVTLAVSDNIGRDYRPLAERFGYWLIPVQGTSQPDPKEVRRVWREMIAIGNPIKQSELIMRYGFDPLADAMFATARDLCANSDAVIGHFFVYPLRVAAELAGLPMATLNVVHNCLPSAEICPPGVPDLGRWSYPLAWRLVQAMVNRIFLPRVNGLRTRVGLAPNTDLMTQTWASEKLNIIGVSPSICRRPRDWSPNHLVSGFLNPPAGLSADEPSPGLEEFLLSGEPPVYFTFGSMMIEDLDYIQEVAAIWSETVRRLACRAIFQLPWHDLAAFPTDKYVFKVRRSPYKCIFPRCAAVVHHGGAGTTQSSLLAGRPSVIVAHMSDQFFWGSELERLGVAGPTQRRKGLSARALAKSIANAMESPTTAERAKQLGLAMSREDGVSVAVEAIERLLLRPPAGSS
jgi:UDP:flavonoid glycosyltransferase YjiC (YdhE family)